MFEQLYPNLFSIITYISIFFLIKYKSFFSFLSLLSPLSPLTFEKINKDVIQKFNPLFLIIFNFSLNLFISIVISYVFNKHNTNSYNLPLLPISLFLFDIIFSIFHRLLHTTYLFRKIHYIHHRYTKSNILATNYSHPIESVINYISIILPIILLNFSMITTCLYSILITAHTTLSHCGYIIKWNGYVLIDPTYHDNHHRHNNKNYATMEITDKIINYLFSI
jgi:sterol desaturase/sphingolipid hydroxylase (fatty acid hydroxylase superfamily)